METAAWPRNCPKAVFLRVLCMASLQRVRLSNCENHAKGAARVSQTPLVAPSSRSPFLRCGSEKFENRPVLSEQPPPPFTHPRDAAATATALCP